MLRGRHRQGFQRKRADTYAFTVPGSPDFLPGDPVLTTACARSFRAQLLFQSENPGLKYEYTVPELNASRRPEFHWRWSDWSPCTVTCGGGAQESQPRCVEKEAGLVEDTHCDPALRPATRRRPCSRQPCPARWWTGPWQPCSATCGGLRRHTVLCVRSRGKADQLALRQEACDPATRPRDTEPCPDDPRCPGAAAVLNGTSAAAAETTPTPPVSEASCDEACIRNVMVAAGRWI